MSKAAEGGKLKKNLFTLFLLVVSGAMVYSLPYFRSYYYDTFLIEFGLNDVQMGALGSAYGSFAVIAYFLGGFCADRWPARKLLTLSLVLTGVLGLVLLLRPGYWGLFAIHAIWGITSILTFWNALIKALRSIASSEEQGRVFGLFEGGRGVTNMVQSALILALFGIVSKKINAGAGLNTVIIVYSVINIALGVLIFLFYKEEEFKRDKKALINVPELKRVVKMPETWLNTLIIFCSYAMCCSYFYITPYATEVFGATAIIGAAAGCFSQFVRPVGCFISGFAADKIGASKVCAISFCVMIVSMIGIICTPGKMSLIWIVIISLAGVYASMYACQSMHFAIMEEAEYPVELTGTATAILTPLGYSAEAIAPLVAGYCLQTWAGEKGYKVFFVILTVVAVVGLIANLIWLARTKEKRQMLHAKK